MLDLTHSLEQVLEADVSTVTLTKQQLWLRLEECKLVQFDPMVKYIHSKNIVHRSGAIIPVKLLSDTKEPHELLVGLILEAGVGQSCFLSISFILLLCMHFLIELLVYLIHILVTCGSSVVFFVCCCCKPGLDTLSVRKILFLRAAVVSACLCVNLRRSMWSTSPRLESRRCFDLYKVFSCSFFFFCIFLVVLNIHVIC